MAVTPGSVDTLNSIKGVTKIIVMTAAEGLDTDLMDSVFEGGILIQRETGAIVLTDGVTKLKDLSPIVDEAITAYEKAALAATFTAGGVYQAVEGGFVIHGAGGKINDTEFNFITAENKIDQDYLDFMQDGKIKLENLPDTARAGMTYCATYTAMTTAANDENKKGIFFVIDATDDPSGDVTSGAAMYVWDTTLVGTGTAGEPAGDFLKIAEHESLDIDPTEIASYDNVELAGAVMYDHPIEVSMTLSDLKTLVTPAP